MQRPLEGRRRLPRRLLAALAAFLLAPALASVASAEDSAATPANYVAGLVGTTLGYRPQGGPWQGFQHDVSPALGYGRQISSSVSLELDAGPTYVRGTYSSFSLTPGVIWSVHPNVYLAARFIVPVDPRANLVLSPGVGVCRAFGRLMPLLEVDVTSAVGRGHPDLGVSLTAGVLVFF